MATISKQGYETLMHHGNFLYGDKFSIEDPNNPDRKKMYENFYRYFYGEWELHQMRYPFGMAPTFTRLSSKDYQGVEEKLGPQELDPNKGICLMGNVGTGKTVLLRVMNATFKTAKMAGARKIQADLEEYGKVEVDRAYGYKLHHNLIIDDVGAEDEVVNQYGNKIAIINSLLLDRYDLFQTHGFKTHISTNRNPAELKELYGPRVFDRVREMFQVITWTGGSLRS